MNEPLHPLPDAAVDARGGVDLVAYLHAAGVDGRRISEAVAEGPDAVRLLAQAVVLFGEPPALTPPEVWRHVGAPEELARQLWRAMGFADLPDDAPALTSADVEALARITDYLAESGVNPETAIRFTRLLGQTMGRVADALLSIVDGGLEEIKGLPAGAEDDLLVLAADLVTPLIEHEVGYLLRRHLYQGAQRRMARPDETQVGVVVGFADVVSFTRLSGQLPEGDLAELLERFEAVTSEEIVAHGGRVVKLIGDAVLFTFDDPAAGAECALHLVERFGGDHPELRVGMTFGPVIDRLGDIFGPTVNLASRLVGYARPGSVLVDGDFARALGDAPGLRLRMLRPRDLKGIGVTPLHVLRWGG